YDMKLISVMKALSTLSVILFCITACDTEDSNRHEAIRILEPNHATVWPLYGTDLPIIWYSELPDEDLLIQLVYGGEPVDLISENADDIGHYNEFDLSGGLEVDSGYRIRITRSDEQYLSDEFSIAAAMEIFEPGEETIWTPGEANTQIRWDSQEAGGYVRIELWKGNENYLTIADSTENTGSLDNWEVPILLPAAGDYRLRILKNAELIGFSKNFSIGSPLSITFPDSNTVLGVSQRYVDIYWDSGDSEGYVYLDLYRQGHRVRQISYSSTSNDGQFSSWDVPGDLLLAGDYRVRITHAETGVFSYSQPFTITESVQVLSPAMDTVLFWGQDSVLITWAQDSLRSPIRLEFGRNNYDTPIADSLANTGEYYWKLPDSGYNADYYKVKLTCLNGGMTSLGSRFTIADRFSVLEPDSSTVWELGEQNVHIAWGSGDLGGGVRLELFLGDTLAHLISGSTSNSGSLSSFDVPSALIASTQYRIRITHLEYNSWTEFSDYFSIASAFEVVLPDDSTIWSRGQENVEIRWNTAWMDGYVTIELFREQEFCCMIAPETPNSGSLIWGVVPESIMASDDYSVRIVHESGRTIFSEDYRIE
ncbi:MAG: hypothetical protein KDC10_13810, partial [Calditrichaeota bacterium]|nr:hypothetical protein [Calditrichota bacterium]